MSLKRLKFVSNVKIGTPEMELIRRKGLMFEFLMKKSIRGKRAEGSERFYEWNPRADRVDDIDTPLCNAYVYYERYTIDEDTYYLRIPKSGDGNVTLYKETELIMNDRNFTWKDNNKYNAKEAVVKIGVLEYQCIVNNDGNGKVIVRYVKCENFHRNKVTIAEFEVADAYNESFMLAIKNWSKEFKDSIAA